MKAIIFDFDGVIADTYDFNMGITKEVGHNISHENFKAHHDGNVLEEPRIAFTKNLQTIFSLNILKKSLMSNHFFHWIILKL